MKTTNQTRAIPHLLIIILPLIFLFSGFVNCFGDNITNLEATYSNGQVFLTWTNSDTKDIRYNVYRSTTKYTSSDQIKAEQYLGFVMDNSGQNIHLSQLMDKDVYYRIKENSSSLSKNQGLYVITCTNNQPYYYAVTTTNLSNGSENKAIIPGENSLNSPINETVDQPLPVLQETTSSSGEKKDWYVQYVNNQETPLYPAMNSTGSYGFNFYLAKRGNADKFPIFLVFEGSGATANTGVGLEGTIDDCYILGLFDWLPIPSGGGKVGKGDNTYFSGYHENFNIYSDNNPIPSSGTVKMYVQTRIMEALQWAKENLPVDATRVYTKGLSSSGYGALLTSMVNPTKIAADYSIVEPMFVQPLGIKGDLYQQMWGTLDDPLQSDVPDPRGKGFLPAYQVLDARIMVDVNEDVDMPLIFDVHGKKDITISWSPWIIEWYDSLQSNHVGGVFYWDQRNHSGDGKNFSSEETTPDFYRYQTNLSYPAFSHCSINQDPGNGIPTNGDPVGAINGYLQWDNIIDNECNYSIDLTLQNLYVSGALDLPQYNTCNTDVTFRRLQEFNPKDGSTVRWKNLDEDNNIIQSGAFEYNDNKGPITIKDVKVNKSGNRIELKSSSCFRIGENALESSVTQMYFTPSANGYTGHVDVNTDQRSSLYVYDLRGQLVMNRQLNLQQGTNTFEIQIDGSGIFVIELRGETFTNTEKLLF